MAWDSPNDIFCAQEDVERRLGSIEFKDDPNDNFAPNKVEVEANAKFAASKINQISILAGDELSPPASTIADLHKRNVVIEANAVGAAYLTAQQMLLSGHRNVKAVLDQLREEWIAAIGDKDSGGKTEGFLFRVLRTGSLVAAGFTDADVATTTLVEMPAADARPPLTEDPSDDLIPEWN